MPSPAFFKRTPRRHCPPCAQSAAVGPLQRSLSRFLHNSLCAGSGLADGPVLPPPSPLLILPAHPPALPVLMSDIMYGSACLGWLDARGPLQNPVTRQQCMSASVAEDSRAPRWAEPREKSHSSDLRGDECQVRRRATPPTSTTLSPRRAPHHI